MNKALLSLIVAPLLVVSATYAVADDTPAASADVIKEYTQMCVNWAKDEDIADDDLNVYVLNCVNDELESEGYSAVTSVKI